MRKYIKYLTLPIILIISIIFISCNNSDNEDEILYDQEINAKYLNIDYSKDEDYTNKQIIKSKIELDNYINTHNVTAYDTKYYQSIIDEYNDEFFSNKSIIIFYLVESSGGNVSAIKSYLIEGETITINVATLIYGNIANIGYRFNILELNNSNIKNISNIVVNYDYDNTIEYGNYTQKIDTDIIEQYYRYDPNTARSIINTREELEEYLVVYDEMYYGLKHSFDDYDEEYFSENSLVMFGLYVNTLSVINAYAIVENTITINVKSVRSSSDNTYLYYFILRLEKDKVKNVTNIVIRKDGEVVN